MGHTNLRSLVILFVALILGLGAPLAQSATDATVSYAQGAAAPAAPTRIYLPHVGKDSFSLGSISEVRALWVQIEAANTPAQADAMLARAVRGKFNTILYLVGGGVAYYRSGLLPQSSIVTNGFDPLAYLVQRGHAKGLRVEAWWAVGVTEGNDAFRSRYPNWDIAVRSDIPDSDHWLNFSLPEVRTFVANVVADIATRYAVDGVHLDYIRYESPFGTTDYRQIFSNSDVPNTVQLAYQKLKAARPNTLLTASVLDSQYRSANHMQNWASWLSGNYIDRVYTMAYFGPDETSGLQDDLTEYKTLSRWNRIMPGLSTNYSNEAGTIPDKTASQLNAEVNLLRQNGFKGLAVFDESHITSAQLDGLASITR